jgi:hypothetical protein
MAPAGSSPSASLQVQHPGLSRASTSREADLSSPDAHFPEPGRPDIPVSERVFIVALACADRISLATHALSALTSLTQASLSSNGRGGFLSQCMTALIGIGIWVFRDKVGNGQFLASHSVSVHPESLTKSRSGARAPHSLTDANPAPKPLTLASEIGREALSRLRKQLKPDGG